VPLSAEEDWAKLNSLLNAMRDEKTSASLINILEEKALFFHYLQDTLFLALRDAEIHRQRIKDKETKKVVGSIIDSLICLQLMTLLIGYEHGWVTQDDFHRTMDTKKGGD
jgi:hypothetical protein